MDKTRVKYKEIVDIFGVSRPMNDAKINAVQLQKIKVDKLTCTGETYLVGPIMSELKVTKPSSFGDGILISPSITFINDPSTGFYRSQIGDVSFVTKGAEKIRFNQDNLYLNVPLTTTTGNLKISASGPNIDFDNKTLVNYKSIANPNRYDIIGDEIITNSSTLTTVLALEISRAAYSLDLTIIGTSGVSSIVFVAIVSIKNPTVGALPTYILMRKFSEFGPNPNLVAADFAISPRINGADIQVVGTNTEIIKWRASCTISRQIY